MAQLFRGRDISEDLSPSGIRAPDYTLRPPSPWDPGRGLADATAPFPPHSSSGCLCQLGTRIPPEMESSPCHRRLLARFLLPHWEAGSCFSLSRRPATPTLTPTPGLSLASTFRGRPPPLMAWHSTRHIIDALTQLPGFFQEQPDPKGGTLPLTQAVTDVPEFSFKFTCPGAFTACYGWLGGQAALQMKY